MKVIKLDTTARTRINADTLNKAKENAARQGKTVSEVMREALERLAA